MPDLHKTSTLTNWITGIIGSFIVAGGIFIAGQAVATKDTVVDTKFKVDQMQTDVEGIKRQASLGQDLVRQQIERTQGEIKEAVKSFVSRDELQARIAELHVEDGKIRAKQSEIELEIFKLKSKTP